LKPESPILLWRFFLSQTMKAESYRSPRTQKKSRERLESFTALSPLYINLQANGCKATRAHVRALRHGHQFAGKIFIIFRQLKRH
jgi:hypothetical protein